MKATRSGRRRLPALKRNDRNTVDGLVLLRSVEPASARLAFLDPQYRAVLDKMRYGNEGHRQKARHKLPQMSDGQIGEFVTATIRALKPSGHMVLWADKFTISSGHHMLWWDRHIGKIDLVDLIAWNKIRPGMGKRTRCYTEYALVFQKAPRRAKGIWKDRGIMDCWPESADRALHAHAKPTQLTYRLIRCLTSPGDLVIDPCAGGYGVLAACQASGREFLGGDVV